MREELKLAIDTLIDKGWVVLKPTENVHITKTNCCAYKHGDPGAYGSAGLNMWTGAINYNMSQRENRKLERYKWGDSDLNIYTRFEDTDDDNYNEKSHDYVKDGWEGIADAKLGSFNIEFFLAYVISNKGIYTNNWAKQWEVYSEEEKPEVIQYIKEKLKGGTYAAISKTKAYTDISVPLFLEIFDENLVYSSRQFYNTNHSERKTNSLVLHFLEF